MKAKSDNPQRREFMRALLPCAALLALLPDEAKAGPDINRPDVTPERRQTTQRDTPLTPPGSRGAEHFSAHCIGCQLCVESCPNKALKTSMRGTGVLQPVLGYEYGYCRPNCVKCGQVCPAGAIEPISAAQKAQIRFGVASVDFKRCVVNRDKVSCTACQRICPNGAISLITVDDRPDALKRPVVDKAKCTGCGACEYICAARPLAAITVNGLPVHESV